MQEQAPVLRPFRWILKSMGITKDIMDEALSKALKARTHILSEMNKVISEPRKSTKPNAPQIQKIKINKSKIREVIGSGGKGNQRYL